MTKLCPDCGVEKTLENTMTGKQGKQKGKLRTRCHICECAWRRGWQQRNRDKMANYGERRRTRKLNLADDMTHRDWNDSTAFFKYECAYCGTVTALVREHVVPVKHGGGTTRNNIVPACAKCNGSKNASDMVTWFQEQPFFDETRLQRIINWMGQ